MAGWTDEERRRVWEALSGTMLTGDNINRVVTIVLNACWMLHEERMAADHQKEPGRLHTTD